MNFPRREDATNKELISTIIEIQGHLMRYGKSHTNWHETLNEVIERLEQAENEKKGANERSDVIDKIRAEIESLERFEIRGEKTPLVNGDKALEIIDKYKAEREESEEREEREI